MPGLFADAISITESADLIPASERVLNKLVADFHEIGSPPGHENLQKVRAEESEPSVRHWLTCPPGLRLTHPAGLYHRL